MNMNEIHDYARRFLGTHGEMAEAEAARKAAEFEKQGDQKQAEDGGASRPQSVRCVGRMPARTQRANSYY
jgi:hypothetical protein